MNKNPMTPRKFCKFALVFSHLDFPRIAAMVKDECLPSMNAIAEDAADFADSITPSEHTLPSHCFLHELAAWASEQAGKVVAA